MTSSFDPGQLGLCLCWAVPLTTALLSQSSSAPERRHLDMASCGHVVGAPRAVKQKGEQSCRTKGVGVQMNHLGIPQVWGGPEILHFSKPPGDAKAAQLWAIV